MKEQERLEEADGGRAPWRRWGPYLSERQWGAVREDYSPNGTAWDYLSHDQARSRAYRWGEDGIAGFSDNRQQLCLALALWNGQDPILKERLFGLTNSEGNHGEDSKELYYYLDATPTHSYLKMLYKYPQREFPYNWLVEENRRRSKLDPEFELIADLQKELSDQDTKSVQRQALAGMIWSEQCYYYDIGNGYKVTPPSQLRRLGASRVATMNGPI
jgi:hypothetical protein